MGESLLIRKGGGGGLEINEIIQEYTVGSGPTISAGSFVQFIKATGSTFATGQNSPQSSMLYNDGGTNTTYKAILISSNRVLLVYRQNASPFNGMAAILSFSGQTISAISTPVNIRNTNMQTNDEGFQLLKIGTEKALVIYGAYASGWFTRALTVSDTTITLGNQVTIVAANNFAKLDSAFLETDKVIIGFRDWTPNRYGSIIITISGTTVSIGTKQNSADIANVTMIRLMTMSSTKVILYYGDETVGVRYYFRVLTISGATVSIGTTTLQSNFNSSRFPNFVPVNSTKLFTFWFNAANTRYEARIVNYDSSTDVITLETLVSPFTTGASTSSLQFFMTNIGDNDMLLSFSGPSTPDTTFGNVLINCSGNTPIIKTAFYSVTTEVFGFPISATLENKNVILVFANSSNNLRAVITKPLEEAFLSTNKQTINGLAKTSATPGQTIEVYTK
jgi:hypothetical protein